MPAVVVNERDESGHLCEVCPAFEPVLLHGVLELPQSLSGDAHVAVVLPLLMQESCSFD